MTLAQTGEDILLQVRHLRMYFPVTSGVIFQRKVADIKAVDDVSFNLRQGETLGLVGLSGAGKSTVVWLALRFYDPLQGRVLLGDRDLRDLPLDTLREQVSVVTQDTYLFNATIRENLRIAGQDATDTDIERAAEIDSLDLRADRIGHLNYGDRHFRHPVFAPIRAPGT